MGLQVRRGCRLLPAVADASADAEPGPEGFRNVGIVTCHHLVDAMRMRGNTCAKQVPICTVSLQFVISSVPYLSV